MNLPPLSRLLFRSVCVVGAAFVAPYTIAATTTYDFEDDTVPAAFTFTGGDWEIDTSTAYAGSASLRSAAIGHGASSRATLNVALSAPAALSFAYRVDAEICCDHLELRIDDVLQPLEHQTTWWEHVVQLEPGAHTISWTYRKDGSVVAGSDAAWIDDVRIAPAIDEGLRIAFTRTHADVSTGLVPTYQGLEMVDLDGDGRRQVVVAARQGGIGYWYVAEWKDQRFSKRFVSHGYPGGITDLHTFVVDGQTRLAVLADQRIAIYDLKRQSLLHTIVIDQPEPRRVHIADVDGDGTLNAIVSGGGTYIAYPPDCPCTVSAYRLDTGARVWRSAPQSRIYNIVVGDFNAADGLEVVLANTPGIMLSGTDGRVLWSYPLGFGVGVAAGNFVGDDRPEYVTQADWGNVTIFDGRVLSPITDLGSLGDLDAIAAYDFDGDGRSEFITGSGQWGEVRVFDAATKVERTRVDNPEHGVGEIVAGDLDGDGIAEIVFGAGASSSGEDSLIIGTYGVATPAFVSSDEAPAIDGVRVMDVDGDGAKELLYVTPTARSGYGAGRLHVLDASTLSEKAVSAAFSMGYPRYAAGGFDVGSLQPGGPPRVVVTSGAYLPTLEIYDPVSALLLRSVNLQSTSSSTSAVLPRIRENGNVIYALNGRIVEMRMSDDTILWTSVSIGSQPIAMSVGDIDGDGADDVVALASGLLAVFNLETRLQSWLVDVQGSGAMWVDTARRRVFLGANNGIIKVMDVAARSQVATFTAGGPVKSLWTATLAGRSVLFAVRDNGVMETFDLEAGSRIAFADTGLPGFGAPGGPVAEVEGASGLQVWGASAFGVHRATIKQTVVPLFADGFETD